MTHSVAICIALVALPLGVACDKPSSDAQGASTEAGATASDFAKLRDDYRQQKQKDLAVLDKNIADVDAKEKAATTNVKADLDVMLTSVKAQRSAFAVDLDTLDRAGASEWDATKGRLDKEWSDLKAATDKATIAAATVVTSVFKPGQMTCQDFISLADVQKPKILYWEEGFNKNGKPIDSAVDVAETDKLVPVIMSECNKSPTQPLSKVIQAHPLDVHKSIASAPKPTTMTCQDFIALEDVAQPRVVYWSEGFNKDGGAPDAVVDIDGTDRLVPVLVQECKETPKLTFWQKIKKYF